MSWLIEAIFMTKKCLFVLSNDAFYFVYDGSQNIFIFLTVSSIYEWHLKMKADSLALTHKSFFNLLLFSFDFLTKN
jgi:hypothetical protein